MGWPFRSQLTRTSAQKRTSSPRSSWSMALRVTQFRSQACLDLRRIREIRADVVATILVPAQSTRGRDELTSTIATLTQLDRYEQRARARLRRSLRAAITGRMRR